MFKFIFTQVHTKSISNLYFSPTGYELLDPWKI